MNLTHIVTPESEIEDAYADTLAIMTETRLKIIDLPQREVDPIVEALEVETEVLRQAVHQEKVWGQVVLKTLWQITQQPYQAVYGVANLHGYAVKALAADASRIDYHIHIVERMLEPIAQAANSASPFINPKTQEIITPDTLIEQEELLQKLKAASFHFDRAVATDDHASAQRIMDIVLTKASSDVRPLVKAIAAPEQTFKKINLEIVVRGHGLDVQYVLQPTTLTKDEWIAVRAALGNLVDITERRT